MDDEQRKRQVVELFKTASKGAKPRKKQPTQLVTRITGDHNVVGHNNVIINEVRPRRVRVEVRPGDHHITDQQAATLQRLVREVVELEQQVMQHPKYFQAVWAALNAHCGAPSYRLIARDDYPRAETYLRRWIGRLSPARSAPARAPSLRNRRYAYIKTNVRQLGIEDRLAAHLEAVYGVDSIAALPDEQLEQVYRTVAGWKRAAR